MKSLFIFSLFFFVHNPNLQEFQLKPKVQENFDSCDLLQRNIISASLNTIRKRKITVEEYHFALSLFPREFPERDEITITDDVSPTNNAPFVRPTVGGLIGEGSILMNMGNHYEDCLANKNLFAHELTHVWQIRHFSIAWYLKEFVGNHIFCQGDPYTVNCSENIKLGDYNAEQQGVLVSRYYSKSDLCAVNVVKRALETKSWELMIGGSATDISISSHGDIYLINKNGKIYNYTGKEWRLMSGYDGASISANSSRVLVTNRHGKIYEWKNGDWKQLPGSNASDIAVNSNGEIWMVNFSGKIYIFNVDKWEQMPGSNGKRISSDGGQTWLTNRRGNIYKFNYQKNEWTQMPGSSARDIAVSNTSQVFITNTDGYIYKFNDGSWIKLDGYNGATLSANQGQLLLVNTYGRIFKRSI
ncbi:MAG: hypothetical protein IPP01_14780 [Saprospiraceae bacterium]|nr:hypothetical protein [Saprospiraceae bacterium]